MNKTIGDILKLAWNKLNADDYSALQDLMGKCGYDPNDLGSDDELSTEQSQQILSLLRDKMGVSDISQIIDMLGAITDYQPAEDDFDRDPDVVPSAERKAAGTAGMDRRRARRRPRSFVQMALDTVLKRGGNKSAAKAEADAADYAKRWPEIARVGGLPTYGAKPQATKPRSIAEIDSYNSRFPDAAKIMH